MHPRSYVKMWAIPCRVDVCAKTSMGGGRLASTSSGSTLRSILPPCNKLRLSANQSEEFQITRAGKNLRRPVTASIQTAANVRRPRGLGAVRSPSLMRTGAKTFQGLSKKTNKLKTTTRQTGTDRKWISDKACRAKSRVRCATAARLGA